MEPGNRSPGMASGYAPSRRKRRTEFAGTREIAGRLRWQASGDLGAGIRRRY
jgi:hypothetical protein